MAETNSLTPPRLLSYVIYGYPLEERNHCGRVFYGSSETLKSRLAFPMTFIPNHSEYPKNNMSTFYLCKKTDFTLYKTIFCSKLNFHLI